MAIKAIVFDCFGVLIQSGRNLLRQDFPELNDFIDEICVKSDLGRFSRSDFNKITAEKIETTSIDTMFHETKETVATNMTTGSHHTVLSTADLWNIQRMTKSRTGRRYFI